MRWRLLIWVAVGIGAAAAAGLGVDVAVAGLDRASGLAGVMVGFCELGALALGVAAWAAERRAAAGQADLGAITEGTDSAGGGEHLGGRREVPEAGEGSYVINADKIDRSQFGHGNTQRNA
ncbi:hypothetical protein [Streptomyces sp. H39-S7]|uniref:hypothetical protein n=1 Tax=Streptomyces sp. H39-S7 TaxID=3004357 RepID=UPI0022AED60E|nr:hypothetical protein [Streptomyces sp. H39-S7]MCZ4120282.1 hypothetical protein [Streptomyces sp. H39-S7]